MASLGKHLDGFQQKMLWPNRVTAKLRGIKSKSVWETEIKKDGNAYNEYVASEIVLEMFQIVGIKMELKKKKSMRCVPKWFEIIERECAQPHKK